MPEHNASQASVVEALKRYVSVLWDLAAKLRLTGFLEWGLQLERVAGLIEQLQTPRSEKRGLFRPWPGKWRKG
ncbi:MAG: hypothetical protein JST30_01945 [Armatimonadetes bacterium]|nr:hypothetical protein [Armatimonadota bacterium]